jgi:TolA-binding protein
MSADRHEEKLRDATSDMARGGDEMEHRLDKLEDDIDDARSTATQRQDAPEQTRGIEDVEDVAGDWEGESSGAQQGDDAEDTEEGPQAGAGSDGEAEPAG